jgi:hypothetical protein
MALRATSIVDLAAIKAFLSQQPATAVAVTSITSVGTLATATAPNHGLLSGQLTTISGATPIAYNGTYTVTVIDVNHFTYVFAGSATSPATGTIVSRGEDTSVDTILTQIGDGISNWIENETAGFVFQPRSFSEVQRGTGKAKLFVKKVPLLSVTTLTDNGVAIAPADYVVADPMLGMIELLTRTFSVGAGRIAVTYRAGFDNSNELLMMPADATLLCLELVKAAYAELTSGAITFQSITAGPAVVSVRPGLNPRHQRMLTGLKDTRI